MKWFILFLLSLPCLAEILPTKVIGKIESMKWDGDSYTVNLNNYLKPIVISGNNEVVPCLENAQKSEMQVLVTIDSDIPMIKSCKLYTPGIASNKMQAQEERPEKTSVTTPEKKR